MFTSQINFEFKWNAKELDYEALFKKYHSILQGELKNLSVLNYLSSHDDGSPFDAERKKPFETATKLLLSPGTSQVYYGDESARVLVVEGAVGDANLRSFMNWEEMATSSKTKEVLEHWQKLGKFRQKHPAIGAGIHQMITQQPYYFYRSYQDEKMQDLVIVGLGVHKGAKSINVSKIFKDGMMLHDAYSGVRAEVKNGRVTIDSDFDVVLLEQVDP
jgi:alpha-amylase